MQTVMICIWDNTNFNMKHIPSGYQVNISHDVQSEKNEDLPVILTYCIQGRWKFFFFTTTILLIYNFEWLNFIMEKTLNTAEIHVSRKCNPKDHIFGTFFLFWTESNNNTCNMNTHFIFDVVYATINLKIVNFYKPWSSMKILILFHDFDVIDLLFHDFDVRSWCYSMISDVIM